MRRQVAEIDPVVIRLDTLPPTNDLHFSGIDLKDGARVTVAIDRERPAHPRLKPEPSGSNAVLLVLTIEMLDPLT